MEEKRTPSLSTLTFEEFTEEAERRRKEPVYLRHRQSSGFVKKAVIAGATLAAIVVGSMYAGAKCEKQISAFENDVTSYVSGSADSQTYAAEVTNKE